MFASEQLESRRLFAVTAAVVHSKLYVWGDSGANGISVSKSGSNLLVKTYHEGQGYQTLFTTGYSGVSELRIYGYDGPDTISVNQTVSKPAVIMGGRGGDFLYAGAGETTLWGHGDWESDITGSHRPSTDDNATDVLTTGTGAGATIMFGQGGNDQLHFISPLKQSAPDQGTGNAGNDLLYIGGSNQLAAWGSSGTDTFMIQPGKRTAVLMGGSGTDAVDFANFGSGVYATNDGIQKSGSLSVESDRKLTIESTIETLMGTDYVDLLANKAPVGNVIGRDGDDTLYGGSGRDYVDGGNGNDIIHTWGDKDTVFGQNGNDLIDGGEGNDNLDGGNDSDTIYGMGGNDTVFGQGSSDYLYGGGGYNMLVGGSGSDYIVSKNGSWYDTVVGDNLNGSGATNSFDVAVVDLMMINGVFQHDNLIGVESFA